jgi:hypothetical protein
MHELAENMLWHSKCIIEANRMASQEFSQPSHPGESRGVYRSGEQRRSDVMSDYSSSDCYHKCCDPFFVLLFTA